MSVEATPLGSTVSLGAGQTTVDEEDLANEVPMSSQDVPVVEGRQQAEKLLQTAAKSSGVRGLCGRASGDVPVVEERQQEDKLLQTMAMSSGVGRR